MAKGRKITHAAMVLVLVTVWTMLGAPAAFAWTHHGCRYDPATISPISYRHFDMYDAYETAFAQAQSAWDATSAPGYFSLTSSSDPDQR